MERTHSVTFHISIGFERLSCVCVYGGDIGVGGRGWCFETRRGVELTDARVRAREKEAVKDGGGDTWKPKTLYKIKI